MIKKITALLLVSLFLLSGCKRYIKTEEPIGPSMPAENSQDKKDQESSTTNTTQEVSMPQAISTFTLTTTGQTQIDIKWAEVKGLDSYNIYRAASENGSFTKVGNSKTPSYSDKGLTASTTYWYKLSGVNSAGEGELSKALSKKTAAPIVSSQTTASTSAAVANKKGNSFGNLVNWGLVTLQGDWVYYSNPEDGLFGTSAGMLYKVKLDGTGKTKISSDGAYFINVVGEWIYYSNVSDGRKLYKIKADGTGRAAVSNDDASFVYVEGEYIYYTTGPNNYLYRININGSGKKQLTKQCAQDINFYNGYIYYRDINDNNKLYKVKLDGTGNAKVSDESARYVNVSNGWIYFARLLGDSVPKSENGHLYKMKVDGTELTQLDNIDASRLNLSGGWIYYVGQDWVNDKTALYKIKTDGTGKTKIGPSTNYENLQLISNWVYFQNFSSEDRGLLYRVKTSGASWQKAQ